MIAAGLAVALAREGMPFRKAHHVVGSLVAEAQKSRPLAEGGGRGAPARRLAQGRGAPRGDLRPARGRQDEGARRRHGARRRPGLARRGPARGRELQAHGFADPEAGPRPPRRLRRRERLRSKRVPAAAGQYPDLASYLEARARLVERERAQRLAPPSSSAPKRKRRAAGWPSCERRRTERVGTYFPPAHSFLLDKTKRLVAESPLLEVMRRLPKGGILHVHGSAGGDSHWLGPRRSSARTATSS